MVSEHQAQIPYACTSDTKYTRISIVSEERLKWQFSQPLLPQ